MPFVKSNIAVKFYNVDDSTLRRWARNGKIKTEITNGNQWRYWIDSIESGDINSGSDIKPEFICYARVSSVKQKADLQTQVTYLRQHYPTYTIITDIGSGINYKRPGFKRILEGVFRGTIKKVMVANRDRFSRFGFDLFEWIFQEHGATLESIQKGDTDGQDIVTDLMEIITVFSARYYGKRKYSLQKDQDTPEFEAEAII
jgi:predicted site-specific integrase-resolvase